LGMSKREILGIWRDMPIYRIVMEELARRTHGLSEKDLLTILKKEHGITITRRELYQALLKLEINGYIKVEHVGKSFIITLTPYAYKVFGSR